MRETSCKNCDAELNDKFKFCPECGQKIDDNLSMGALFNNTLSNYFSVDAKINKSLIPLVFKPGFLPEKFIEGKRLKYLHPAQFYLSISVIFFFLFSISTKEYQHNTDISLSKGFENGTVSDSLSKTKKNDNASNINGAKLSFSFEKAKLDSLIANNAPESEMLTTIGLKEGDGKFIKYFYSKILKFYSQRGMGFLKTFYGIISISLFFLMPLFALFLKILFYKNGQFSHHLVFTLYFFTFIFSVFSIIILFNFFVNIPSWIIGLVICAIIVYLILGMVHFYKRKFLSIFFRAVLLLFVFTFIVLPATTLAMVFITLMLY